MNANPPDRIQSIELGELNQSLGYLIRIAQQQVFQGFFARLGGLDLKPGEFTVLWVIGYNPGLPQGAIARKLHIKPAHMTKLIQRLVVSGYVDRAGHSRDRRHVRLTLTDAGYKFVQKHRDAFLRNHAAEHSSLTETETGQLLALLQKFVDVNEAQP